MYGKGLRALSISTAAVMTAALALVFFYAPLEAEQGFLQKISTCTCRWRSSRCVASWQAG